MDPREKALVSKSSSLSLVPRTHIAILSGLVLLPVWPVWNVWNP